MSEYLIGKKGDFKTFAEAVPQLKEEDIVTFMKGLHPIEANNLTLNNITLRGTHETAYTNTMLLISANKNDPSIPAFRIPKRGGIAINSLSIVVAPKVRPFIFDEKSVFTMGLSNLVWNHFKLTDLNDNLPLLTTESDTTVMEAVDITESIVSSVDLVARKLNIDHTALGSPYGQPSYISGFTNSSTHNFVMNAELGMVGEIYSLNILGDVSIVDTNADLIEDYPNLKNQPLTINNLLFQKFDPRAIKVSNTWTKNAESLLKKLNKEKANPAEDFYLENVRSESPLYIISEPKGKGSRYAIPHDKGLLTNSGTIIIRGENNAQTTWPNVQKDGIMALANYKTGIPYRREGGELYIHESSVHPTKGEELQATLTEFDIPLAPTTLTEDMTARLLWTPEEIQQDKFEQTPIYNELLKQFDKFILEDQIEQFPILLIGNHNYAKTISEISQFLDTMTNKQVLKNNRLVQFSETTLRTKDVLENAESKNVFLSRLGSTWIFENIWAIDHNPKKANWITIIKNVQRIPDNNLKTLQILVDTPENLTKFEKLANFENYYRYDAPE